MKTEQLALALHASTPGDRRAADPYEGVANSDIDGCPEAREALRRWEAVRERRLAVESRIAELEVGRG